MEKKPRRQKRKFEEWETAFMILAYPEFKAREIGEILDRSQDSVREFISRKVKIKKPDRIKIGDKFGKLTVLEVLGSNNKRGKFYRCVCDCGKEMKAVAYTLTSGHSKSCGCERIRSISKGFENISGKYFNGILKGAESRNIPFEINIEIMNQLLIDQDFRCKLTNLPIAVITNRINYEQQYTTASLDRIDSSKGYTKDNIQWIHVDINWMKHTFSQEYLIYMCNLVANNNKLTKKEINEKSAFYDSKKRDKKRK